MNFFRKDEDRPPIKLPSDFPRFCHVCGSVLVLEVTQTGFSETTGCPVFSRWLHCPRWTGGRVKVTSPTYGVRAREVAPDGCSWDSIWDVSLYSTKYLDCLPAYEEPPKPVRRRAPRKVAP